MPFVRTRPIRLRMTDAAGVLFFAEQLALVHDVEEDLFASLGFPVGAVLREGRFALPIVHCETDFLAPLVVDDVVEVALSVSRVGESSFTLAHTLTHTRERTLTGRGLVVHACLDPKTRTKSPLPDALRRALEGVS